MEGRTRRGLLLVLLLLALAACGRGEVPPTVPPATPGLMGPLPPPATWTVAAPTAMPSATARPRATPTAPAVQAPPPEREVIGDGWLRYPVPDTPLTVEVPERFYVVQLEGVALDAMMTEMSALFPGVAAQFDLRTLFEQNVRLLALDVQGASENANQSALTLTVLRQPIGEESLASVLALTRTRMEQSGATNLSEPQPLTVADQEAALLTYDLWVGSAIVRGTQLYILTDNTLYLLTAAHPTDDTGEATTLVNEIIERVDVQE